MARKRGMQFIPYDYEAAYNKAMEDMHEWFIENLFQHRKKVIYALKEITAGDQFEIEIYPQFRSMDEVPPEGRTIKKDNNKAQKNLNDKNARKYVERLINENFSDRDIWMTLTYDDAHLPPDGDVDAAIKNVQKYIRRINYQRKKRGLPNAKYAKYIGVSIKTEGSSQPEIIINPRENFDAKFDYYMEAYDDDLILIAAKGKKDIRIVAAGHGNRFEDIENQLIGEKGKGWRELIAGAIDNAYDRLIATR